MINSQMYCSGFGSSKFGQLGQPSKDYVFLPTEISTPEPVFLISAGEDHTILLTENSRIYSMGRNTFGQLGLGHNHDISSPTLVTSLQTTDIEGVFCGYEHSIAISPTGEVNSWGLNLKCQLGLGDHHNRNLPTLVELIFKRWEKLC